MNITNINKLVNEALAIDNESVLEANAIGFMARMLVQATIPHKKQQENVFVRKNGYFSLAITAHPQVGLPYGVYPRLILAWMVTEAIKTKSPNIVLGKSLNDFMLQLNIMPTGGRWGTITMLKEQLRRLLASSISCIYHNEKQEAGLNFNVAKEYKLWWDNKNPKQSTLWQSTITLSTDFFNEIVNCPIPIDMRVLKAIKQSSMAIDLYCWLTYRMSYLKTKTTIPWHLLQEQFGSDYAATKQGRHKFKSKLILQLQKITTIYQEVNVLEDSKGLTLLPSKPHVKKSSKIKEKQWQES